MATRCIPHIYNPSLMTEDEGCILCGIHRSRHGSYDIALPTTITLCRYAYIRNLVMSFLLAR